MVVVGLISNELLTKHVAKTESSLTLTLFSRQLKAGNQEYLKMNTALSSSETTRLKQPYEIAPRGVENATNDEDIHRNKQQNLLT